MAAGCILGSLAEQLHAVYAFRQKAKSSSMPICWKTLKQHIQNCYVDRSCLTIHSVFKCVEPLKLIAVLILQSSCFSFA